MWFLIIGFISFIIGLILSLYYHRNDNLENTNIILQNNSCISDIREQKGTHRQKIDGHELWRIVIDVVTILSFIIGVIGLIITLSSKEKTEQTPIEPNDVTSAVVDSGSVVSPVLPGSDSLKNQKKSDQGRFIMGSTFGDNDIVIVNLRYESLYPGSVEVKVHENDICTLYNKDDFPRRIKSYDNIVVKLKYRYPETFKTTISKFTIDFALTSDFGSKYSELKEVDVSEYIDINNNPKKP